MILVDEGRFFVVGSGGGVSIPPRGREWQRGTHHRSPSPGIKRQRLHVGEGSQEDERWRREASMRQPAGKRETTVAAAAAAAAAAPVMVTGNAAPPPSWDLATTITTTPANDHCGGGSWCRG